MNGTRYDKRLSSSLTHLSKPVVVGSRQVQLLVVAANVRFFSKVERMAASKESTESPCCARRYSCVPTTEEKEEGRPNLLKTTTPSPASARSSATAPPKPPTTLCSSNVKTAPVPRAPVRIASESSGLPVCRPSDRVCNAARHSVPAPLSDA